MIWLLASKGTISFMPIKQPKYSVKQVGLLSNLPEISREPRFRVKVNKNSQVIQNAIILSLECPSGFTFIPGQYIWLVLPECSKDYGVIDRGAYSISSGVNNPTLDLFIRTTNNKFTSKVKKLKIGEEVDIIGPMGSAFLAPISGVIMISGGTGISPFLSIIRSHMAEKLHLIAYNSNKEESIYYDKELQKISDTYDYQVICKTAEPQPSDFRQIISKKDKRPIFISGPQGFVDTVTNILLDLGVKSKRMRYEKNYPQTEESKLIKDMFATVFHNNKPNTTPTLPGVSDFFLQIVRQSSNYVIITDHNGYILFANQSCINMTGYTLAEMQGQSPRLWGGLMPYIYYQEAWRSLKKGNAIKRVVINRRRDGSLYTAIATTTPILRKGIYMSSEENITTLREVDKTKTEFISIASHQLRTPLSVVNWYAEMLLSGDIGKISDQQIKYLREIYLSNQRMTELVNSLLDVSRLELGTFVIKPETTNIVKVAQNVVDEQKIKIDEKHLKFSFQFEESIPTIQSDPKFLRIVMQNLLSNAVKYTPVNGKINITISLFDKNNVLLKVSDTGLGIPKDQRDKIFTKFFRADNVRSTSTEGTGLGLYIVKSVVENSGGKIWFTSKKNKGTVFNVLIPVKSLTKKKDVK